jgi:hypothetical protein
MAAAPLGAQQSLAPAGVYELAQVEVRPTP